MVHLHNFAIVIKKEQLRRKEDEIIMFLSLRLTMLCYVQQLISVSVVSVFQLVLLSM